MSDQESAANAEVKTSKGKALSKAEALQKEIEALEAKAKAKREQLREETRKARDKNAKEIMTMIQAEGLADYPIEAWKAVLSTLKSGLENAKA